MAKFAPKTRVIVNGVDVSTRVFSCNLPRNPGAVEVVELTIEVSKLELSEAGTLTIRIDTEE